MTLVALAVLLLVFAALAFVLAGPPPKRASGDLALHHVEDDVFFYRGFFSNSAVFVFPSCVVVVDSQVSPLAGKRLRAAIEKVTSLPVKYVINTHFHGDHTGGNAAFPEAEIIGNAMTARFVTERDGERFEYAKTFGLEFAHVHSTVAPTRTFEGRLTLSIDGDPLEILQLGAAETSDACVVHWPSHHVVATGDGVSTWDYPYLGTPFVDEGLHDDGEWVKFLGGVRGLGASVLLPGHGPAIVGEPEIRDRLDLLASLMSDIVATVKEELRAGTPLPQLVQSASDKLAHYVARPGLKENTVSQKFAIYRAINSLIEERRGRGWWNDLRPSVIKRASRAATAREMDRLEASPDAAEVVRARATLLAATRELPLAIAVLEDWTSRHESDATSLALLADLLFDGAETVRPTVDATEYFGAASRAAKASLAVNPSERLALLNLGALEVFGGMVLAQPMERAITKLETALGESGEALTAKQRRKATFFLGKAHQVEGRTETSDVWYREVLPSPLRALYPLVRKRLQTFP